VSVSNANGGPSGVGRIKDGGQPGGFGERAAVTVDRERAGSGHVAPAQAGFLAQLITSAVGSGGVLRSFEVTYRGIDLPRRPCRCRGLVTAVTDGIAELEVWTEDPGGTRTTIGKATVQLPEAEAAAG